MPACPYRSARGAPVKTLVPISINQKAASFAPVDLPAERDPDPTLARLRDFGVTVTNTGPFTLVVQGELWFTNWATAK